MSEEAEMQTKRLNRNKSELNSFNLLAIFAILTALVFANTSHALVTNEIIKTDDWSIPREPSKFRLHPYAGGGVFQLRGDYNYDKGQAYQAGVLASTEISGFSLEGGLGYMWLTAKGTEKNGSLTDQDGQTQTGTLTMEHQLHYVTLPLIAKYNFVTKPLATFFVKTGIINSFLVGSQTSFEFAEANLHGGSMQDNDFADYVPYATVGFGGTAPLDRDIAFILDLNYQHGLTETHASEHTTSSGFTLLIGISAGI